MNSNIFVDLLTQIKDWWLWCADATVAHPQRTLASILIGGFLLAWF